MITAILVISRIIPHPANFTPLSAMALWGGAKMSPRITMVVILVSMLISDLIIGLDNLWSRLSVYGSLFIAVFIGKTILKNAGLVKAFGTIIGSSLIFFLLTNFAVWRFSGMYPINISGLTNCFLLAIPFFRNSIISDMLFSGVIVGGWELVSVFNRNKLAVRT